MWIFIWLLVATFILGFFAWSTLALLQQKRAWKKFAEKHELDYDPGKMLGTAYVTGRLQGLRFNLFSGTEPTDDVRGQRYMTIIEFEMGSGMRVSGAVGTPEMKMFIDGLNYTDTLKPKIKEWNEDYLIRTHDADELAKYFTDERQIMLHKVFSMKNSVAIFLFDKIESVLRIETSDPLVNEEHLEKVIKTLIAVCKKLKPEAIALGEEALEETAVAEAEKDQDDKKDADATDDEKSSEDDKADKGKDSDKSSD